MQARKPLRLPGYDYTRTGLYFVTICLRDRTPLLGQVEGHLVRLSPFGEIVAADASDLLAAHLSNFAASVRTRQAPTADLSTGLGSGALCHWGNAAYRAGCELRPDQFAEAGHRPPTGR